MFRNLPSECAPSTGIQPTPNCSSNLTFLTHSLPWPLHYVQNRAWISSWHSEHILWQNSKHWQTTLFHRPFPRTNSFVPLIVHTWNSLQYYTIYMRLFSFGKHFCDLFLLLFFLRNSIREKRGGKGREGEDAWSVKYESKELCCSQRTNNHQKLKFSMWNFRSPSKAS